MTWRDRAGFFRTSGRGTTPAVATKPPPFCCFSSSDVCPCLTAQFLSVDCLVFCYRLSPSCRRLSTIMPDSFASKTDLSPPPGMEGLCRNIAAIGSTPPPLEAGSSLGCASVLAQGMGEGLLSKFAVQTSGKWSICLSRLLIVENDRGLRGGFGGMPLPWHPQGSLEVTIEIDRGRSGGINKFKINNCRLTRLHCRRNGGGQEDRRRRNPSEGNGGEHLWNCCHRHRWSSREGNREDFILQTPPPASKTGVDAHLHHRIGQVDKGDALLPAVPPHRATGRPCSQLIRRATSPSPQPLPYLGHRGYRS